MSSLGQPLIAEIEVVSVQPGEEDGLAARLGSPEAYATAGIELNPAVISIRFAVEKRGNRMVLKLTSTQPISEPFLDVLVELQWNAGRLLREYTFLLDPPDYRSRQQAVAAAREARSAAPAAPLAPMAPSAPAPVPEQKLETKPEAAAPAVIAPVIRPTETAPVESKPEAAPQPETKLEAAPLPPQEPAPVTPAAPRPESAAPVSPTPMAATPAETTHEVIKGDTLGAIAKRHLPPGVTLNQMLIAIYRANEDAFIRGNVNLVRAGRILTIPDADSVGTIDREEANQLVSQHHAQFNEYRARLAAVPVRADSVASQQETAGRIEPKPQPPAAATPDQLRLSKADPKKPAASEAARAASGDDAVARERALKEAQSRQAELEKNVSDLRKLLELKNQQIAEMEKRASAKPAPAAPTPPAPSPAAKAPDKPAPEAPKPAAPAPKPAAEVPKPAAEAPKLAAPAPAAKAPEKPVAEAPKPAAVAPKPAAEAPKPAAPKPAAEAPKPAPAKPQAAPEPGILDQFLDNTLALGGLALVVLLLGAYGYWAWRRKKLAHAKFQNSVLGAASVGSASAAASLVEPTGAPAAAAGAAGAAAAAAAPKDADEVDPIAEADVYMAYGRDAQAEEILKEALQKDASRTAVHAKLLEIYANRKDAKAFEQSALKLKGLTNGAGPDWDKAAALGRSIDPGNGLYAGAGGEVAAVPAPAAAPAPAIDFDLGGGDKTAGASAPDISLDEPAKEASAPSSIDFDLGRTQIPVGAPAAAAPAPSFTGAETVIGKEEPSGGSIDFNLDLGGDAKPAAAAAAAPAPAAKADGGLDFDLNLDGAAPAKGAAEKPVDLASISLDLGTPDTAAAAPSGGGTDPKWQEVATKLDLAKAYEEMGDKDGARELLNDVMKDGDAAQKGQAQQLLTKLG